MPCTHAQFGLSLMSFGDAVVASVLGIVLGVLIVYLWHRWRESEYEDE